MHHIRVVDIEASSGEGIKASEDTVTSGAVQLGEGIGGNLASLHRWQLNTRESEERLS